MKDKTQRIDPESVLEQIKAERPQLASAMEYDRNWLWYCGPKPDDTERELLKKFSFRYKAGDHRLPSGKTGRWYYWHSVPPIKPKNGNGKYRFNDKPNEVHVIKPTQRPQPQQEPEDIDAMVREILGM